jgi:hypothetical protein
MSESIWWADNPWWERKSLPLGFITLSFRQLTTIAVSFAVAYIVSLPFQFPIAGFGFGGRASVFCLIFGVGYVISNRRIRMLPVELQAVYLIRTRGIGKLKETLRSHLSPGKNQSSSKARPSLIRLEMLVEDFRNPIPLVVTDRVKSAADETRVLLMLDGEVRVDEALSPRNPRYMLAYVPLPQDIGERTLTVKLANSKEPLASISLSLVGKSRDVSGLISKGE